MEGSLVSEEGLRSRQKRLARDAILDAVARHVAERGLFDFSIPQIAKLAGVSHRTVYNYFPNRDALVDAFSEWANARMNDAAGITMPDDLGEVPGAARRYFPVFSQMAGIATAFAHVDSSPGSSVPADYHERRARFRELVAAEIPAADEAQVDAVAGLVAVLASSRTWHRLTTDHGLDGQQAGAAVGWLLDRLVEAVRSGDLPVVAAHRESSTSDDIPPGGAASPHVAGGSDDGRRDTD